MEALSNRYTTDMELTQLFQKSRKVVLPKYLQEKSHCRKKKKFMMENEDYSSNEQAWQLQKKRISKCPMHFCALQKVQKVLLSRRCADNTSSTSSPGPYVSRLVFFRRDMAVGTRLNTWQYSEFPPSCSDAVLCSVLVRKMWNI